MKLYDLGAIMLNEKTSITIKLFTLLTCLVFMLTASAAAMTWKSGIEHAIDNHTKSIECIEEQLEVLVPAVIESQVNIKWIRETMEKE